MRWLDSNTNSMDTNLSKTPGESGRRRSLAGCSLWGHIVGHNLVTEQQQQRVFPAIRCEHKNYVLCMKLGALFGQPWCAKACQEESVWHWLSGIQENPPLQLAAEVPDSD